MSRYTVKIVMNFDNGRVAEHAYNATGNECRTIMRFFESMTEEKDVGSVPEGTEDVRAAPGGAEDAPCDGSRDVYGVDSEQEP